MVTLFEVCIFFQSILALGMICLATSVIVEETQIWSLSCLLFLLNLLSSIQDIAVDSLAVNILDDNELGVGNTVQVVAYKVGSMFAGSLLLFVREAFGWSFMLMAFASIYFVTLGSVMTVVEFHSDAGEMKLIFTS